MSFPLFQRYAIYGDLLFQDYLVLDVEPNNRLIVIALVNQLCFEDEINLLLPWFIDWFHLTLYACAFVALNLYFEEFTVFIEAFLYVSEDIEVFIPVIENSNIFIKESSLVVLLNLHKRSLRRYTSCQDH